MLTAAAFARAEGVRCDDGSGDVELVNIIDSLEPERASLRVGVYTSRHEVGYSICTLTYIINKKCGHSGPLLEVVAD